MDAIFLAWAARLIVVSYIVMTVFALVQVSRALLHLAREARARHKRGCKECKFRRAAREAREAAGPPLVRVA